MRTSRRPGGMIFAVTVLSLLVCGTGQAHADLALTQAGIDQGFTLTTFATGFPSAVNTGPLGIAFPASGGVLVADYPGNVRLFPTDTDGQSASQAPVGQNYRVFNAVGLARVGNSIYMTQQGNGAVVQVNPNGTLNQTIVTGLYQATGIAANPTNGNLFVSTSIGGHDQVFAVNPTAKTATLFLNSVLDGLTVSPDGKTLYGAGYVEGRVVGYDTSTGAMVYQSAPIVGGVDGIALGSGTLAGDLFANTNSGSVVEINLTTGAQTIIAAGGSRGDFVVADPNNASLLLTQSDNILRLTPPSGGGFIPTSGPEIPEPSTVTLLGLGLAAVVGWRWRRNRRATG